jgi:hypothetical protein
MITWEQFKKDAIELCEITKQWTWKLDAQEKERQGFGYLVRMHCPRRTKSWSQRAEPQCGDLQERNGEASYMDPASLCCIHDSDIHFYDYHILYSTTYRVPTLYFNVYRADGSLLTIDEVWDDLTSQYKNEQIRSTFITQTVFVSIFHFVEL